MPSNDQCAACSFSDFSNVLLAGLIGYSVGKQGGWDGPSERYAIVYDDWRPAVVPEPEIHSGVAVDLGKGVGQWASDFLVSGD